MQGVVSPGGVHQTEHQFLAALLPEMSDSASASLKRL
jgi:hypothetical protein